MGLFGRKEIEQLKEQNQALAQQVSNYQALMTPELEEISRQQKTLLKNKAELADYEQKIDRAQEILGDTLEEIKVRKEQVVDLDDEILLQEFGLYKPRFDFQSVDEYKQKLTEIRTKEKEIIKVLNEESKKTNLTYNNSASQGKKMFTSTVRLTMRAFNDECDAIIRKVKFSNIEASVKSIRKSAETINKLGVILKISIPQSYVDLKVEEAYVSYEYAKFKEEEKERIRELRAQEREEAKLRKEIEEQRKKLEKERKQNENALKDIVKRLKDASEEDKQALLDRKSELEETLGEISKATEDIDYREANQRAGYVYVISNIGSFGENVFKIGMTRRLDPIERIKELSDASVPFNFDVHAMIFTEDAPGLEAALHREFEDQKVNKVNGRREFFKVTLDDIKRVVKENYDKSVSFEDFPDAEQYRTTLQLEKMSEK